MFTLCLLMFDMFVYVYMFQHIVVYFYTAKFHALPESENLKLWNLCLQVYGLWDNSVRRGSIRLVEVSMDAARAGLQSAISSNNMATMFEHP